MIQHKKLKDTSLSQLDSSHPQYVNRTFYFSLSKLLQQLGIKIFRWLTSCFSLYLCLIISCGLYVIYTDQNFLLWQVFLQIWQVIVQYFLCKKHQYYYPFYLGFVGSVGFLIGLIINEQCLIILSWIFLISAALCAFIFKNKLENWQHNKHLKI